MNKIKYWVKLLGLDSKSIKRKFRGFIQFRKDLEQFKKHEPPDSQFIWGNLYPCLTDRYENSGTIDVHYFLLDIYVARQILKNKPSSHADVGSRIDGLISHLSVFRKVTVIDIRPLSINWGDIEFIQADIMESIPVNLQNKFESVSSLHAVEHFGLGRYGDPVDYWGYAKGMNNIDKLLAPGGRLYFAVPIGQQRIEFNAHRVFDVGFILEFYKESYVLERFSYIDDHGNFHENRELNPETIQTNFGCNYGCGIFEFLKL